METQTPQNNQAAQIPTPSGPMASGTGDKRKFPFAELPKYVALAGSVLYAFSFIIWYAYLAQYGLSPTSLWNIEFISASLCYFTIALGIALPAALLLARIPFKRSVDLLRADGISIYPLLILSAFLWTQISNVFLGGQGWVPPKYQVLLTTVCILLSAHCLTHIFLQVRRAKGRKNPKKFEAFIMNDWIIGGYFLAMALVTLLGSDRADAMFVGLTGLFYLSVTFLNGFDVQMHWKSFSPHLKVLTIACVAFLLVANARTFAMRQFGKIPRAVGGGEPLRALLILGREQRDLASLLGIPKYLETNWVSASTDTNFNPATQAFATNVESIPFRYGPVSILTKSEREIVFFIPVASGSTNRYRPHAKVLPTSQVQGIEFLNEIQ